MPGSDAHDQSSMMDMAFTMRRRDVMIGATAALAATACKASSTDRVSLFDYMTAEQQRRIAAGSSDLDCAPLIERALREAIAARAPLWFPRGTYLLEPAQPLEHADPSFACLAAVRMVSGMRLVGERGTVLRIVPGFSSDHRPRAMAMFATTAPIADIGIAGLTLDMNGRANPISPDRHARQYSRFPQAQIFVSSRNGVPTARIDRARITDTVFRDANGVSCVVMAQNSDPRGALGRNWTLQRCAFEENGHDTDDHSSIFAYAEDVAIDRCRFANARPFDGTGVNTAYEVHGSRQRISQCTFSNMMRGIWVANNYSAVTSGTRINDNRFATVIYGIDFFNDRASARTIVDTRIERNEFLFDDRAIVSLPALDFKAAVQVASEFGQRNVRVSENRVAKQGHAVTSAFLVVTGGADGPHRHDDIVATGNAGEGLTFGSFIRTTATAGLGQLTITQNDWRELSPSSTMAISAGDAIEHTAKLQPIEALTLGGGSAVPAGGQQRATNAIFLNGYVRSLTIKPIEGYGDHRTPLFRGGAAKIGVVEPRGL